MRRRYGGGVDIIAWAYQDDGLVDSCCMSEIRTDSVGKEDQGHARLWSDPITASNTL